jgi:hypothetical protein
MTCTKFPIELSFQYPEFYFSSQALTPCMQIPVEDSSTPKAGRLLGSALVDQHQGVFSFNLWNAALCDAFSRICPLRASGHECGCLPVLAKLV